jgi:hypothetical protein
MTSKSKNVANILYDSVLSTVNTIQTTDDLYIEANGSSKTLFLDCDADDSVINIGVKSGQNKNINIGNQGTGIITMNENAKILKTTDTTASFTVSNTTGYGNKSLISTGCSGGGALYMISNGQGTTYNGIPHGVSGICSYWGDMVLATGNGSTHSEKLRLSTTAITASASIIPNTTATYNLGSSTNIFNSLYVNDIFPNSTTGNETLNNTNYATQFITTGTGIDFPTSTSLRIYNINDTQTYSLTQYNYNSGNSQKMVLPLSYGVYKFSYSITSIIGNIGNCYIGHLCNQQLIDTSIGTHIYDITVNSADGEFYIVFQNVGMNSGIIISNLSLKAYSNKINLHYGFNADVIGTSVITSQNDLNISPSINGKHIYIGGGTTFNNSFIVTQSNILPSIGSTFNIGSSSNYYYEIYCAQINCSNARVNGLISTNPYILLGNDLQPSTLNISIGSSSMPFLNCFTKAISNTGNLSISTSGAGTILNIDNDNDNSIINIGYYDGSTTTQSKTINIGDLNDTSINIYGIITSDFKISRSSSTVYSSIYNGRTSGGLCYNSVGAYSGGEIKTVANSSGSSQYGIPNGATGIASVYNDLYITTGNNGGSNATTRLQFSASDNYLYSSVHILPSSVDTYNIGSSALHFNNMYANAFNTMSDKRLKTNIRPLQIGLNFINNIKPVEFNYIKDTEKKDVYGFIAQDIDAQLNDENNNQSLIKKPENEQSYYSIEYSQFTPIIIKSIQELYNIIKNNGNTITQDNKSYVDEIDILKNEIELLKSEITKLKKDLKKIKS